MASDSNQVRTGHPFFMFDAIREQPAALIEVLERNRAALKSLATELRQVPSLTLAGIGTSLNAAMLGEHWLRNIAGVPAVRAVNSFELARYSPPLAAGSALIVISHRGWKQFSARVVAEARRAGVLNAVISGRGPLEGARQSDRVFITCDQEKSGAHTKSLTTTLALLFDLTLELRSLASGDDQVVARLRRELDSMAGRYARRVEDDGQERAAAERFKDYRRILFLGAGPNCISAREAALKMKEATFTYAEALQLEEFLHGPISAVDPETLVVLIAPRGPASERAVQIATALGEIGAARLAVVSPGASDLTRLVESSIAVEGEEEAASPFAIILSLQLFTYYSALARGCDPDKNRREDPRYDRAKASYQL